MLLLTSHFFLHACNHTDLLTVFYLFETSITGGEWFDCARQSTMPISGFVLLALYYILTALLLLNMLIAIMAKSFDKVWDHSSAKYIFLFSQKVRPLHISPYLPISLQISRSTTSSHLLSPPHIFVFSQKVFEFQDAPAFAPPLYLLSIPYQVYMWSGAHQHAVWRLLRFNEQPMASGLHWVCLGDVKPSEGRELINARLAKELVARAKESHAERLRRRWAKVAGGEGLATSHGPVVSLDRHFWDELAHADAPDRLSERSLRTDHFIGAQIRADDPDKWHYYQPTAVQEVREPAARKVGKGVLAEAMKKRAEEIEEHLAKHILAEEIEGKSEIDELKEMLSAMMARDASDLKIMREENKEILELLRAGASAAAPAADEGGRVDEGTRVDEKRGNKAKFRDDLKKVKQMAAVIKATKQAVDETDEAVEAVVADEVYSAPRGDDNGDTDNESDGSMETIV